MPISTLPTSQHTYFVLQFLLVTTPLHTLTAWLWSEGLHCFAGSVAVGADGPVLLLHLLPVLEPLQQQQRTQPAAPAHAHEDSQLCAISPAAAQRLPS